MKHRGIRIAILCVMSVLLALAPFTCARAENEGGLFGIYYEDELISLASKMNDNKLCTWYSDRLEALYEKEVEVRDFYNQKYLAGKIGVHPEGLLAIIECNDMLAGERVSYTSNVVDGGEYKLKGWTRRLKLKKSMSQLNVQAVPTFLERIRARDSHWEVRYSGDRIPEEL